MIDNMSKIIYIMFMSTYRTEVGSALQSWMQSPENYDIQRFAIEHGHTLDEFERWAKEDEVFSKILIWAKATEEYKVYTMAMGGTLRETTALEFLKKRHGWKATETLSNPNDTIRAAQEAQARANNII